MTVLVFDSNSDSAFISSYVTISSVTSLPICDSITQYYLSTSTLLNKLYPNVTFCTTTTPTQVRNGLHTLPICDSITQYYLSTSDLLNKLYPNVTFCTTTTTTQVQNGLHDLMVSTFQGVITKKGVVAKKKYKPVALKVKPVIAELPEQYQIHCHIIGDPLQGIPTLNLTPPLFTPTGRYILERCDKVDRNHGDFLWDEECTLMHDFMYQQNRAFA